MSYRFVLVALLVVSTAQADIINVGPGDSIQADHLGRLGQVRGHCSSST